MSGPNPPGWDPDESDSASELSHEPDSGDEVESGELDSHDGLEPLDDSGKIAAPDQTGQTDAYSRAYSAPESEHFVTGPYVPADPGLYDYDGYDDSADHEEERGAPRWPWVVGVAAITAAVALVVSVSLLVARTDTTKLANPGTTTTVSKPPLQDEITTTKAPPPPSTETPTATETQTVTVTPSPPPPPPPAPTRAAPPPATTSAAAQPPTTTTPAGPRQVTYSVTGTKAPGDIISVTYVDASGRRRTQHNVYIPWSMTVTPIAQSDV